MSDAPGAELSGGSARPVALAVAARALLFALFSGAVSLAVMRGGIFFSTDSWAYWEGSVSVLSGNGYEYFGDRPILDFPPLFSSLLCAAQGIFGISGATLIGTVSFLAAVTTYIWSYTVFSFTHGSKWNPAGYLAAGAVAAFVGARYCILWSETLFLALLGLLVFLLARPAGSSGKKYGLARLVGISVALFAMLLTRNAALVFWPGVALVVLFDLWRSGARGREKLVAFVVLLAAPLLWYAVGALVGLRGHQRLMLGGKYSPAEYLEQLVAGMATELGPVTKGLGYVVLALVVVGLVISFWRIAPSVQVATGMKYALFVGGLSLLGLYVLFNVTLIYDQLNTRFVWHVPLFAAVVLGGMTLVRRRDTWLRYALLGILAVMLVCAAGRAYSVCKGGPAGIGFQVVKAENTISPDYYGAGPEIIQGELILMSPPEYPWLHRNPLP